MNLTDVITGTPVTSEELRAARDRHVLEKWELLSAGDGSCLVEFSLNIAGAVKVFPFARTAFREELRELQEKLGRFSIKNTKICEEPTGDHAFFLLDSPEIPVKQFLVSIEESHPLGRLFNLDVCGLGGVSVKRQDLHLLPRTCLVCGGNANICQAKKRHSMELIQWQTARLFNDHFRDRSADLAASAAVRGLLYEVSTTPKPGLVDRNNSGSHSDMDFFTFLDSSASLIPWFREFFCLGWDHADEADEQIFERLRYAGQRAETAMFSATHGINTHKGLVFASAILCGALGKVHAGKRLPLPAGEVLSECRKLGSCSLGDLAKLSRHQNKLSHASSIDVNSQDSRGSMPMDTKNHPTQAEPSALSNGERIFSSYGIQGARGEAAAGFPSAVLIGLPALKKWLAASFSLNDAAAMALLTLISEVDDTNMVHRGGPELAKKSKEQAKHLLSAVTNNSFKEILSSLDEQYIAMHLSPGGCADLLAVSLMFHFLETCGMISPVISSSLPHRRPPSM
ncbi:citrate lyase holo-[acyl-carrier protein] synthase [Clostridium sp. AF37-5AT]|nr:citrate lyase holo-[acyl-carrier protein] synthase [Clostridium sp. AF37-5AT]RHO96821.1 citrate lyase holo-[acyl-carrier protein] synthase [Clostridium sp. AF37-5AT]